MWIGLDRMLTDVWLSKLWNELMKMQNEFVTLEYLNNKTLFVILHSRKFCMSEKQNRNFSFF